MIDDDLTYKLALLLDDDKMARELSSLAYNCIAGFLLLDRFDQQDVQNSLIDCLSPWQDSKIDLATSRSDFSILGLKKNQEIVFVNFNPMSSNGLLPFMRLFYHQALKLLTKQIPQKDHKFHLLFTIDNLAEFGKINSILSDISFIRGYKGSILMLEENVDKLKVIYNESELETFLKNVEIYPAS